jgi:hypothetical protein
MSRDFTFLLIMVLGVVDNMSEHKSAAELDVGE